MEKISLDELHGVAKLAALSIEEDKAQVYANDLTKLMTLAEQISHLCDDLPAMEHPLDIHQPLRKDEVKCHTNHDELLALAPKVKAKLFTVPQVMQKDDSE